MSGKKLGRHNGRVLVEAQFAYVFASRAAVARNERIL